MIEYIVIHSSDSPDDRHIEAVDIHQWHQERGFDGIGYNHVIQRDGTVEAGRPHYWTGAHVRSHNHHSIGICLVGRDEFTDRQNTELKKMLYWLKFQYQQAEIVGHYQLDDKKTCPNFDVPEWVSENMPGLINARD